MAGSSTGRLGLYLADPQEEIDVTTYTNPNFQKIDAAQTPIVVNDDVVPPNANLYEGALVLERTSGRLWAAKVSGASFVKQWQPNTQVFVDSQGRLTFSTVFGAKLSGGFNASTAVGGDPTAFAGYPVDTVQSYQGTLNWAVPAGGKITVPAAGYGTWQFTAAITWPANTTGIRGIRFVFGSDPSTDTVTAGTQTINAVVAGQTRMVTFEERTIDATTRVIRVEGIQTAGVTLNGVAVSLVASKISPLSLY